MGLAALRHDRTELTAAPHRESALEQLQLRAVTANHIGAGEITTAIEGDAAGRRPLNLAILMKLLASRRVTLTRAEIENLACRIRDEMIRLPLTEPELFVNYARCAAACMQTAASR